MCDSQRQKSHGPLPGCAVSAPTQIDPVEPRTQYEEPGQQREEDWRRRLRNLQECICGLLIRNQELRMALLESATNHQCAEADK
jgi:hypothetical protein